MAAGLKPDSASLGYQISGRSLKSICCVSVQKGKNKERPYLLPFHNALMPPIDYFSQLYLANQSSSSLYLGKWAEARDWQSNINWTKLSCSLNGLWTTREAHVKVLAGLRDTAAAAAKSLQSCPTLCDPIDGSPSGSPAPRILQARTLGWVAISFSNA